ncbi:hypothetical protein DRP77_01355 [Candidatus Poribacteria bacterium]|nr:MAG: hypothetical protein DRP77_01355 [Candidatus Poribacteria bacterium]
MLKTLEDVIRKLIEEYKPEGIILFGSRAAGEGGEHSDYDLLIIKRTDKRQVERQIEVEKLLSDRAIPLDLFVYTPWELWQLVSIGSPFITEALEKGRVLYMRRATREWLRDAEDEFKSAAILHEHGFYRNSCYHSQQCVEKCLKCLILEGGSPPRRTHDLVVLLREVNEMGWDIDLDLDDAAFLNGIYRERYPTEQGLFPHGLPSAEDSERALGIAEHVLNQVKRKLSEGKSA